eukprot:scaffold162_cov176-Amphora_coffeaeformis.AAC.35
MQSRSRRGTTPDCFGFSPVDVVNDPFTSDEKIPIFMAALMGLQHAFSMVGGLITVPYVIFRFSVNFGDTELQQYAISASLICSGICSLIQVSKFYIPFSEQMFGRKLFIGSGLLSVMGTSFTFLPLFEIAIQQQKANGVDGRTAYANMLGTSMVTGLLELCLALLPLKYLKSIFPPVVTSITVILIGVALTGTGMKYWGGGAVCADMVWKEHSAITSLDPVPNLGNPGFLCENGEVKMGYGQAEYIVSVRRPQCVIVAPTHDSSCRFVNRNCNVIIALLFGYLIAGLCDKDGANYVIGSKIEEAKAITFFWVERFPLGFYGPAVFPLLIAYLVTTVETVGDISAVFEVSDLDITSHEFDEALQGGLTSDALCSIFSSFFTAMPNTTFSQNNGVIALTKCASRRAGYACGIWLILMGVFGKISGIITSIPDCVIGGMTIFLFANVLTSGIALAATLDLHSRRIKFIMALSLAIGVGVTVWPFAFQDLRGSSYTANFWRCADCSDSKKGLRNGLSIFLSTGYCVGTVVAMFLNFILPEDAGMAVPEDEEEEHVKELADSNSDEPQKEGSQKDEKAAEEAEA